MQALDGADALAIMTEWRDYQRPEFSEMATRLRSAVVFDGRNLYEPEIMQSHGFKYHSIGRPAVG
jgi:UDPglucose 6-dehydrogenase